MSDERKVAEVFARYVRATDRRDGAAQAALFAEDSTTEIYNKVYPDSREFNWEPNGEPLKGPAAVKYAVENFMAPHPPRGTSHHVTADHIIDVNGDTAHFSAQFVVFETRADERPAGGWPEGARGVQGTVQVTESGYYETDLRKIDGEWKITHHRVRNDLPFAIPGA
ncbi:nuclear transport factor 2 family protein [Micromonospora musae]|uniref:Nuclear transport factor 2 family protein n=1 Tax=Micromonospora musae TaxID=1894970 RepID=A0A3A9Y8K8_9ACTN|nr:nuclear transport factor 2 family protein [Micromonospora musae]RKN27947.1 nuclear transport factor 2 family protein [Micromonospora musae]